jgi:hypothetical protein
MSKSQRGQERQNEPPMLLPPLTPRPRLFKVLFAILLVWIALLITLYFTTVVPRERHATPPATRASAIGTIRPGLGLARWA